MSGTQHNAGDNVSKLQDHCERENERNDLPYHTRSLNLPKLHVYTSAELEAIEEIENLESITEQCTFRYQLTDGELGWLRFIGERYTIATYLWEVLEVDDDDTGIVTIDVMSISEALAGDGVDRAPCLSDDTQLQRLICFIGPELSQD